MPEYTEHYHLEKPLPDDFYNIETQNSNMKAIDDALYGLEAGKETPAGAQQKADRAKAEAVAACRPADWTPTAQETGSMPYQVVTGVSISDLKTPGMYTVRNATAVGRPPVGTYFSLIVMKSDNGDYVHQVAIPESINRIFTRYLKSATWTAWAEVSMLGHTHGEYVPTTRMVNGKRLSSNVELSAEDVGAPSLDSNGTVTVDQGGTGKTFFTPSALICSGGFKELLTVPKPTADKGICVMTQESTSEPVFLKQTELKEIGKSLEAEKLSTPRTINGVEFDGTKNITTPADSINGFTFAVAKVAPTNAPAGQITFVYES